MKSYDEEVLKAAARITAAVAEEAELSLNSESAVSAAEFLCTLYDAIAQPDESKDADGGCFEIYTDKAGQYRFRMKAANGEAIADSQGYADLRSCKKGVECIRKYARLAKVKEI